MKQFTLHVHTNSKHQRIQPRRTQNKHKEYDAYITAPPTQGKANKKIIELCAQYFRVSKNQVFIVQGEKTKIKKMEIIEK